MICVKHGISETRTLVAGPSERRNGVEAVPKQLFSLLIVAALLDSGCAGVQRRPPPTLEQVIQMSREGVSAESIVGQLEETRAVYALSGSQLARLHDEGVPDLVLDYLLQAYVNRVRRQERMYYEDRMWMGGYYHYRPWVAPYFVIPY